MYFLNFNVKFLNVVKTIFQDSNLGDEHEGMEGIDLEKRRSRLIKLGEKIRQPTGEEEEKLGKLREVAIIASSSRSKQIFAFLLMEKIIFVYRKLEIFYLRKKLFLKLYKKKVVSLIFSSKNKNKSILDNTKLFISLYNSLTIIDFNNIISGGGCYATAGISDPKYQKLSLADGCEQLVFKYLGYFQLRYWGTWVHVRYCILYFEILKWFITLKYFRNQTNSTMINIVKKADGLKQLRKAA
uniref:Uncharacterized protein n=1 Tax=Heterorhabditis bacteriophora TaxID=37862 RepID=A0A1I7WYI3_HETBA